MAVGRAAHQSFAIAKHQCIAASRAEPALDANRITQERYRVRPSWSAKISHSAKVRLWEEALKGQIYSGDDNFMRKMQDRIERPQGREVARAQHQRAGKPLAHYFRHAGRNKAILQAYRDGGHTQTAIAEATGLSLSRVSRLIALGETQARGATK